MKTITAPEHNLILDVIGEGLTPLPAAALEKDLLVTEILQRIQQLDTGEIKLVFCGGTSLSKAHGLIERMSEDIDFKVIVPEVPGVSKQANLRTSWQTFFCKKAIPFLMNHLLHATKTIMCHTPFAMPVASHPLQVCGRRSRVN